MHGSSRPSALTALAFVVAGCGAAPAAPGHTTQNTPRETAPTVVLADAICGPYPELVRVRAELTASETADAARDILCRPSTSERAFAHGLYFLGMRHLRAGEGARALEVFRYAADTYADPLALAQLARLHFHGRDRLREGSGVDLPIARDLGAAICEAWAAMSITAGVSAREDCGSRVDVNTEIATT
jgi:hypothetical protein